MIPGITSGGGTADPGGGGGSDPDFANVVALLHFQGADASTTFTDVTGKTWTPAGGAQLDTAQFKFGSSSFLDPDAVSNISTPSDADFGYGTGDFTIEFFERPETLLGSAQIIYDQRTSGTQDRPTLFTLSGGDLIYFAAGANRITAPSGTLVINTWKHIALCRVSGTTRLFVDGVQVGSSFTDSISYETSRIIVGNAGDAPLLSFGHQGHYAELRITKGVGRYASNFTPPAAAFPNS